ncbi:MAG: hypothetical protein ACXQT5_02900 [Candidatus Syntropharchaeia archaeon]
MVDIVWVIWHYFIFSGIFSGILGIGIALLFLFVKRKIIYLLFVAFLFLGVIIKAFTYAQLYSATGRISGIGMGIGLPLIIAIYLISKYKSAFIPGNDKEKSKKAKLTKIRYTAKYTPGLDLVGIIALFFGCLSVVASVYAQNSHTFLVKFILNGIFLIIASLAFLVIKNKPAYLTFLGVLIMGIISKLAIKEMGGLLIFLILVIYLSKKYKKTFAPTTDDSGRNKS